MSSQDKNMASQSQPVSGAVVGSEPSAAFTPGPWRLAADSEYPLHLIWTDSDAPNSPGTLLARTCFAFDSEANARLIAAAPILYKMLKAILGTTPAERQNPAVWLPRVDAARAAIAKAVQS